MTAITQLEYEWAESGTKTPAPSDEKIQTGWVGGDQPTIEYFNWWMNRADAQLNAQLNYAAGIAVSNLFETNAPSDAALHAPCFHPDIGTQDGRWLLVTPDDTPSLAYYSDDNGETWSSSSSIGVSVKDRKGSIDSANFILPTDNATTSVAYSSDGASWSQDTGPSTAGATGDAYSVVTKYGTSDFVMVGTDDGDISYCTTGVGGTWAVPTVAPVTSRSITSIVWMGGDTFFALDRDGLSFKTIDSGVNWSATTTSPSDSSSYLTYFRTADYNSVDDTICVAGSSASTNEILRSTDGGDSWALSDVSAIIDGSDMYAATHLGGKVWVVVEDGASSNPGRVILSYDDGLIWVYGMLHTSTSADEVNSISYSGDRIMIAADDQIFVSNAVPNLENL